MNRIAAWWAWLRSVEIVIRWRRPECDDWCGENYGAKRW